MKGYLELLKNLKEIKLRGYVRTHRAGPTGIGKTLEDLLGIKENNIPGPNGHLIELKSARKNSASMLTLFTKSPAPDKANAVLLDKVGYPSTTGGSRKELHTTLNALAFNTLRGSTGLKIEVRNGRVEIVGQAAESGGGEAYGYWTSEMLKLAFERKLPRLLYVKAENRGTGFDEEFWYDEAILLKGFSFDNFVKLLTEGTIMVDIRIGQYSDGRTHDHGTGFRVRPDRLDLCFSSRKKVL